MGAPRTKGSRTSPSAPNSSAKPAVAIPQYLSESFTGKASAVPLLSALGDVLGACGPAMQALHDLGDFRPLVAQRAKFRCCVIRGFIRPVGAPDFR